MIRLTIFGQPASKFSRVTYIYALTDPAGTVRYVGKSDAPMFRYRRHLKDVADTRKGRWIRALASAGQSPVLRILQAVAFERWQDAERSWIAKLGTAALTNSTEGGKGPLEPSPEVREKMRQRKLGGVQTLEHRKKVSAALKGKKKPKRTAEHAANLSAACMGRTISAEQRAKQAATNRLRRTVAKSGFKGVYFDRLRGKFRAYIKVNRRMVHLGRYMTAEDAHASVEAANQ